MLLQFDWHLDYNWLVPPISLVPRVLAQLALFRAKGVLVVPKWESSFFWPLLVEGCTRNFRKFVLEVVEYSNPSNFLRQVRMVTVSSHPILSLLM